MALALYRRYRPDTLDGVIGQDQVTVPLARALDSGRITQAYLFSGPRGTGKTSTARILARCLNCEKGPTSHPCGKCPSCKDLATGGPGSVDVVEIDAASHNGVDDARQIRERAQFAPTRDRYKIFILDEAHMVTQQGFNALLKIVEEPPEHVIFIFATTEPDKVIGTIRSRTHHYPFRLVPPEILGPYVQKVCKQEKITLAPGVLPLVLRAGGGSVRDTLSVLDQLMVGAKDSTVELASATNLLGYTPTEMISGVVDALIDRDGAKLYDTVEKVAIGGFEPRRFVQDLLERLRDLIMVRLAGVKALDRAGEQAQADQADLFDRQARALPLSVLTALADAADQSLSQMAAATSPRMKLELLAARLLEIVEEQARKEQGDRPVGPVRQTQKAQTGPVSPVPQTHPQAYPAPQQGPARSGGTHAGPEVSGRPGQQAQPLPYQSVPGGSARQQSAAPSAQTASPVPQTAPVPPVRPVTSAPTAATASAPARPTEPMRPAAPSSQSVPSGPVREARPVQTPVPPTDPDAAWKQVVASLDGQVRIYVTPPRLAKIDFLRNRAGAPHLVFTFDKPVSQHAFAMAFTNGQKVTLVVLAAVRRLFGPQATIAPASTAANGEKVRTMRSMSPEEQTKVKRQIALLTAGLAMSGSSASSDKAEKASAEKASGKSGVSGKSDHAGSAGSADSDGTSSSDDPSDTDDDHHRGGGSSAPAAAHETASGPASGADGSPAADASPQEGTLPQQGSSQQSDGFAAPNPRQLEEEAGFDKAEEHHPKHIAVPDAHDDSDPWAGQEPGGGHGMAAGPDDTNPDAPGPDDSRSNGLSPSDPGQNNQNRAGQAMGQESQEDRGTGSRSENGRSGNEGADRQTAPSAQALGRTPAQQRTAVMDGSPVSSVPQIPADLSSSWAAPVAAPSGPDRAASPASAVIQPASAPARPAPVSARPVPAPAPAPVPMAGAAPVIPEESAEALAALKPGQPVGIDQLAQVFAAKSVTTTGKKKAEEDVRLHADIHLGKKAK